MNKLLWKLLQVVFCRGVDEDVETEAEEVETEEEEVEEAETETEETETEEVETHSEKPESRAQKEIRTLRERAQKAEDDHRKAREELEAARRQPSQSAGPTEAQRLWQEEEELLKNPDADGWVKYNIQSARSARAAEFNSQQALAEARDLKDQAEFDRISVTNPKAAERYKDKVEEMKKQNPNAPRKALLALLMGQDMLDGKFKAATKSTKPSGGANRGKLPGAKSDATSSGTAKGDSIEAIEKRLSGIRI
jgi:hypothetical protein